MGQDLDIRSCLYNVMPLPQEVLRQLLHTRGPEEVQDGLHRSGGGSSSYQI